MARKSRSKRKVTKKEVKFPASPAPAPTDSTNEVSETSPSTIEQSVSGILTHPDEANRQLEQEEPMVNTEAITDLTAPMDSANLLLDLNDSNKPGTSIANENLCPTVSLVADTHQEDSLTGGPSLQEQEGGSHDDSKKEQQAQKQKKKRSPVKMLDHVSEISGNEGPEKYQCNVCHKTFKTKAHIKYHEFCQKGEKPFKCEQCGNGFIAKSHYEYHLRTHTGERPYLCSACGKQFSQISKLKRHMLTHTGERRFSCEKCGRRFSSAQALRAHKLIHTGERPYPCEYCPKRFTGMTNLKKHVITHTGERPFMCTHCGKSFGLKWTLDLHLKTHSDERPFTCDQCSRAFSNNKDLKRHMTVHSGERPYRCQCGTSFRRKDNLNRHIRLTHDQPKEVAKQLANQAAAAYLGATKAKELKAQNVGDGSSQQSEIASTSENNSDIPSTSSASFPKMSEAKVKRRTRATRHNNTEPASQCQFKLPLKPKPSCSISKTPVNKKGKIKKARFAEETEVSSPPGAVYSSSTHTLTLSQTPELSEFGKSMKQSQKKSEESKDSDADDQPDFGETADESHCLMLVRDDVTVEESEVQPQDANNIKNEPFREIHTANLDEHLEGQIVVKEEDGIVHGDSGIECFGQEATLLSCSLNGRDDEVDSAQNIGNGNIFCFEILPDPELNEADGKREITDIPNPVKHPLPKAGLDNPIPHEDNELDQVSDCVLQDVEPEPDIISAQSIKDERVHQGENVSLSQDGEIHDNEKDYSYLSSICTVLEDYGEIEFPEASGDMVVDDRKTDAEPNGTSLDIQVEAEQYPRNPGPEFVHGITSKIGEPSETQIFQEDQVEITETSIVENPPIPKLKSKISKRKLKEQIGAPVTKKPTTLENITPGTSSQSPNELISSNAMKVESTEIGTNGTRVGWTHLTSLFKWPVLSIWKFGHNPGSMDRDMENENSLETDQLLTEIPGISTEMPGSSTQMPGSSTEMSESSNEMPGSSSQMPGSSSHMPGSSNEMPGSSTESPQEGLDEDATFEEIYFQALDELDDTGAFGNSDMDSNPPSF